jgi:non-ribosomal peptide synthase protein (TIGR01720 family)
MQIVARANALGLGISATQLFAHPTIADLAAVAGTTPPIQADQDLVTGPVPLSPRQRRFFANHPVVEGERPDFERLAPGLLVELREAMDPAVLEEAVSALLRHHDALRLRFHYHDGIWEQHNAAEERGQVVWVVDLADADGETQQRQIRETRDQLQMHLSLADGPLLGIALFRLGPARPDRLMLLIHHLVQDGFSTRLLWEDLETAYRQRQAGAAIELPVKTTSFKRWCERLVEYAQSPSLAQDADYWLAPERQEILPLPLDHPEGANRAVTSRRVVVTLDPAETQTLLRDVPRLFGTEINDVLLTALAGAVRDWTGQSRVLVDLKAHGRDQLVPDLDVSRTVGWFTTIYPMLFDLADTPDPLAALPAIKEQLRAVPSRGISYAILRYLRQDPALLAPFSRLPRPQISFNYQGQFDQVSHGSSLYAHVREVIGQTYRERQSNDYVVAVGSLVKDDCLRTAFRYSTELFEAGTIERLARTYNEALRHMIGTVEHQGSPAVHR